jgi:sugar/nucleoside kinase (ribokinase family)
MNRLSGLRSLVTVGYLAWADVLHITNYPRVNTGAVVHAVTRSVVADAPRVAIGCQMLGILSAYRGNNLGADEEGAALRNELRSRGVTINAQLVATQPTPRIVVLSQSDGGREWFAHLPNVIADMTALDPYELSRWALTYLDAYEILDESTSRLLSADSNQRLFINIGEREWNAALSGLIDRAQVAPLIVQASVDNTSKAKARRYADELATRTGASLTVVTLGHEGAVANCEGRSVHVSGFRIDAVADCNNAGAAFSAGLLFGLSSGLDLIEVLEISCALGAMSCSAAASLDIFTRTRIEEFLEENRSR